MSGVEAGVDRIVDQIVNPKLNSTFLPEVETVIYNCFGTTKAENEEEDLLNGNDDHSKNGDAHDQSIGGKISTRNLSTISSDTEMLNVEKTSGGSSPGPGLAGQVSPLTPGASPSVATGAISPLTPAGTPPPPGSAAASTTPSGTPPPPPPGESDDEIKAVMETETVEMEVDTEEPEEARPQSAYTPPLPQVRPRTPPPLAPPPAQISFAQPMPVPGASQSQPPPPPAPAPQDQESGGEASMSSISDTDLGDVSPPQPRKPPPVPEKPAEESSASASGTEDEDLAHLMKMKAELMAQLEGDFKLSPEEDSEDEEPAPAPPVVSGGENLSSDDNLLGQTPPPPGSIPAPPLSSTSGSPSPPPAKKEVSSPPLNPPGVDGSPSSLEENVKEKLSITEGCKPSPRDHGRSPRSPGDDSQGPRAGPADQNRGESQSGTAETTSGSRGTNPGEQGQSVKEAHKSSHSHSHKSSKSSHSSKSHSSRHNSSSSGSMSKEERRKMDKLKQQQRDKIKKYEEKVKSNDRLKSDKFQALDIFSSKKPSTPYQPLKHRKSTGNVSGESTPTGPKPQKKEFEKKLDEAIKKELERREEEKKKKSLHDLKNKASSSRIDDRRRSSDHERSSQKHKSKDHSTNKDNRDKYSSYSRDKKDSSSSSGSRRESTDTKQNHVDRVKSDKSRSKHRESEEKKERRISLDHNSTVKENESKPKAKDEINELLKQKISSLGVDNIQKMLMESLVEKTGASISEDEKQKMITKMENMIKTESTDKPKPVVKSSPKKRARSSSCSSSSGSSTSSSSSDSEEEQIVSKSIKAKLSPKKASEPIKQRPVRQRKVNTFSVQSDESDADSDFIKPVKETEKAEPKTLSPIQTSPIRPKADIDPTMKSFSFFEPEDVKKATATMKAYENLLSDENSVQVPSVTDQDINNSIPNSRLVSMDYSKESEELITNLQQFGGHPRLYKPVPEWLIPYLEGAKVKLEDVEMPHDHEIVDYMRKKETGRKKRKAGWDIVVDWVPQEQPQVKRSKLEKQLGFDFDSSFGCSIGSTDGKRSRRSAVKFGDTSMSSGEEAGDKENTSSEQSNRSSEAPSKGAENDSGSVITDSDKLPSKGIDGKRPRRSTAKAGQEQEVVGGQADTSIDREPETSSPGNENKESVTKDSEEQMNKDKLCDETSPGKKRRSRDIIAAYLNSAGVERANEQPPTSGTGSMIETKSILEKLDVDINEANEELNSVIDTLRNKKKRPQQGELKVSDCHFIL